MSILLRLPVIALLALACGCHVHPLPDQVVGLETSEILHKIRCEAREAVVAIYSGSLREAGVYADLEHKKRSTYPLGVLSSGKDGYDGLSKKIGRANKEYSELQKRAKLLNEVGERIIAETQHENLLLEKSKIDYLKPYSPRGTDDIVREVERRLKRLRAAYARFNSKEKQIEAAKVKYGLKKYESDRDVKAALKNRDSLVERRQKRYSDLAGFLKRRLAYEVQFKITEMQATESEASFKIPLLLGSLTIDKIDPADERERTGERKVSLVASFEELIKEHDCRGLLVGDGRRTVARYPIEGRVGFVEVIEQYMKIAEGKSKAKIDIQQKDTKGYQDKLTFKTTISAGVNPKITLTQATGHNFTGSLDLSGSRTDEHILLVRLTLEDDTEEEEGGEGRPKTAGRQQ